jgi:hypothetical protein
MITYMGLCGNGGTKDCSDVESSTVKWFKIDNAGLKDDGTWEIQTLSNQADLYALHRVLT